MSDVIRSNFRQTVMHNGLQYEAENPNEVTVAAIKESRTMKTTRRKSVKKLFDELESKVRSKP
jgi:antitoxin component of RelBE/YafQ-DinJ toxin-antitoxin module